MNTDNLHRLVTSHAIVGEMVGIQHYATMLGLADSYDERLHLLADAWSERGHLVAMREVASALGFETVEPDDGPYWGRVKAAFAEKAAERDLMSLYLIQDIVLESYAVILYRAMAPAVEANVGRVLSRIADEETEHLADGVEVLRKAYAADPEGVTARVEFANERVARVLAEWVQPEDCTPVCAVCGMVGGVCAKETLQAGGVDLDSLQPAFADVYGNALRDIGLPYEDVARWLARLMS